MTCLSTTVSSLSGLSGLSGLSAAGWGFARLTRLLLCLRLALAMFVAMFLFPVRLFQGFQADLSDEIDKAALVLFRLAGAHLDGFEVVGHDVLEVLLPDLSNPLDSKRILFVAVRQDIPHQVLEYIFLDQAGRTLGHL